MDRVATVNRKTAETDISLTLNLDGTGIANIDSGCGFLDHMLILFTRHGKFDLDLKCDGDVEVDYHHTVEDIGICLGKAFSEALGDKRGITRYGTTMLPMDEALILTSLDFSGRGFLRYDLNIKQKSVGTFDTELVEEFWWAFVRNADCTLHIKQMEGKNTHHIIEGAFKSAGHTFHKAVAIDEKYKDVIPSTKGVL